MQASDNQLYQSLFGVQKPKRKKDTG